MCGSVKTDRRKELCGRPEAPWHEEDHQVWDRILRERMYGCDGVKSHKTLVVFYNSAVDRK